MFLGSREHSSWDVVPDEAGEGEGAGDGEGEGEGEGPRFSSELRVPRPQASALVRETQFGSWAIAKARYQTAIVRLRVLVKIRTPA